MVHDSGADAAGNDTAATPVSVVYAALRCRCPRCGRGALFRGFLNVNDRCPDCGLDLSGENAGDGPAVFIIMIMGFLVIGLALWLEIAQAPPIWVHMAIWPPLIIVGSLALLRPLKALMIALQYKHRREDYGG